MEKFASADYTVGKLNAIVKRMRKQGGTDGVEKFLRGELVLAQPNREWREQDGVIYLRITSDGTTGPDWITRLEKKGYHIHPIAKQILLSRDFKPTSGVISEVAILKGGLFEENHRSTELIRNAAKDRKFQTLNAEIACLIREKLTDEEIEAMGLKSVVVMHEPISDFEYEMQLLTLESKDDYCTLTWSHPDPGIGWLQSDGFAFAASEVIFSNPH